MQCVNLASSISLNSLGNCKNTLRRHVTGYYRAVRHSPLLCTLAYMYILSSFILLLLYNNTFLWAIYFANLLFVASCHCCASDPVLPFKEDFMGCTVSLFSSLSALPLSHLCGMFLLFSLMHIETAYWIVSFTAFLLAIFKFIKGDILPLTTTPTSCS